MAADDGFKPLLHERDVDGASLPLTGDSSAAIEADFSTSLAGPADPNSAAPVYLYDHNIPLPQDGARRFDNGATTAASAEWHCKAVKIAQAILLGTSSVQLFLDITLCLIIGAPPFSVVSSALACVLGLVCSVRYFVGDASNLNKELKLAFVLAAIATPFNLIYFAVVLLLTDADVEDPYVLVFTCTLLGQAGSFIWIALRSRRVKKNLLPNSIA